MFCPRGSLRVGWLNVKHSSPAFSILALAVSIKPQSSNLYTRDAIHTNIISKTINVPPITSNISSWCYKINNKKKNTNNRRYKLCNISKHITLYMCVPITSSNMNFLYDLERERVERETQKCIRQALLCYKIQ